MTKCTGERKKVKGETGCPGDPSRGERKRKEERERKDEGSVRSLFHFWQPASLLLLPGSPTDCVCVCLLSHTRTSFIDFGYQVVHERRRRGLAAAGTHNRDIDIHRDFRFS